jgi:hypothetical protein
VAIKEHQTVKVEGHTVRLERRRYGRGFYAWAYVICVDGSEISLGDPWPCASPRRSELAAAVLETVV